MPRSENPAEIKVVRTKFDFSSFGTAAKDVLRSAINGEFGDSLKTVGNYFSGHFDTPEGQLWRLVWSAAIPAFTRILKNKFGERFESVHDKSQEELFLERDLGAELYEVEFSADASFLTKPHRHSGTETLKVFFKNWLINTLQISEEQATVSAAAFPRLFLHEIVKVDPTLYSNLIEYFERPAYPALKKEALIEAYHAHIMAEYDRPAFSDLRVSLDDMYVEPHFLYYKPEQDRNEESLRKDDFTPPPLDPPLHDFILSWLHGKNVLKIPKGNPSLLLLLGQPGQGKSSFVYRTIYKLLREELPVPERVFMLRLRDLNAKEVSRLISETAMDVFLEKINRFGFEQYSITRVDLDQSLLILDGLDELYMNRGLSLEDIEIFLSNFSKEIQEQAANLNPVHFKCVITSRHNYVKIYDFRKSEDLLVLSLAEMNLAQQKEWLSHYEKHCSNHLSAEKIQGTKIYLQNIREKMVDLDAKQKGNDPEMQNHLGELLNQPLLLQFIVESRANLQEHSNWKLVYDKILTTVIERNYAGGKKIRGLEKIETEDYRRFLQLLALQMYHSKNLYIRSDDFEQEPLKSFVKELSKKNGNTQFNINDLAKYLLTGFYFRSVRKQDDQDELDGGENYAFEFMHNSLFEYLLAEHIWSYFKSMLINKDSRHQPPSFDSVFKDIFKLFSTRLLSTEIVKNIRILIELEPDSRQKFSFLFKRLRRELFPKMLNHDFLTEYDFGQSDQEQSPINLSLAVFYGVITVMAPLSNHFIPYPSISFREEDCHKNSQENIKAGNFVHFGQLKRFADLIQGLRRNDYSTIVDLRNQNLRGANFRGADLREVDLRGANLHGAYLSGVYLSGAKLNGANFLEANLRGANLRGADLSGAYLRGADLREADLSRADFYEADLSKADLSGANLSWADLSRANLMGSNLGGTNLSVTDFSWANLNGADLRDAKLGEAHIGMAYLSGAFLNRVDLSGAQLHGVDLSGVSLFRANLREAKLSRAKLSRVDLGKADLRRIDLYRADLREAKLYGADLRRANLSQSNLFKVKLLDSDLRWAILCEANLCEANLSGADLRKADLYKADLYKADLRKADLRWVINLNLIKNLNEARYLDKANFTGTIFDGKIHKKTDGTFEIDGYISPK